MDFSNVMTQILNISFLSLYQTAVWWYFCLDIGLYHRLPYANITTNTYLPTQSRFVPRVDYKICNLIQLLHLRERAKNINFQSPWQRHFVCILDKNDATYYIQKDISQSQSFMKGSYHVNSSQWGSSLLEPESEHLLGTNLLIFQF